ncbi:hypothetical protein [Enterococcus innesii]|uniref:hypothetical protein n=1 Tax=Enterococcus innesii TaxID=2839759 RepID=UPI0034A252AA
MIRLQILLLGSRQYLKQKQLVTEHQKDKPAPSSVQKGYAVWAVSSEQARAVTFHAVSRLSLIGQNSQNCH